jgi:hypothetical protein
MTVTAQQTTTLPEGAILTVMKWEQSRKNGGMSTGTRLHVHRGDKELEMSCDGVSPANLRQYLELVVREINRRRAAMTEKPAVTSGALKTTKDFVEAMAVNDMFCFEALQVDPSMHANDVVAEVAKEKPKRRRKAKPESVPANGDKPF